MNLVRGVWISVERNIPMSARFEADQAFDIRRCASLVALAACIWFLGCLTLRVTAVKAQETPAQAETKPSRVFLTGILKEDDKQVPMVLAVDPATDKWIKITDYKGAMWPRVSPDRETLAFTNLEFKELWNCDTRGGNAPARIADVGGRPLWSSDGKYLIVTEETRTKETGLEYGTFRLRADGSKDARLPLPKTHAVRDWSRDGKWLLTASHSDQKKVPSRLSVMRFDGTQERPLMKGQSEEVILRDGRFSPDSRQLAYVVEKGNDIAIWVSGVDGNNARKIFEGANTVITGLCWSPDGKRLAASLYDNPNSDAIPVDRLRRVRLVLMNADGENVREVQLTGTTALYLAHPDWTPKNAD